MSEMGNEKKKRRSRRRLKVRSIRLTDKFLRVNFEGCYDGKRFHWYPRWWEVRTLFEWAVLLELERYGPDTEEIEKFYKLSRQILSLIEEKEREFER